MKNYEKRLKIIKEKTFEIMEEFQSFIIIDSSTLSHEDMHYYMKELHRLETVKNTLSKEVDQLAKEVFKKKFPR